MVYLSLLLISLLPYTMVELSLLSYITIAVHYGVSLLTLSYHYYPTLWWIFPFSLILLSLYTKVKFYLLSYITITLHYSGPLPSISPHYNITLWWISPYSLILRLKYPMVYISLFSHLTNITMHDSRYYPSLSPLLPDTIADISHSEARGRVTTRESHLEL